MCRRFKLAYVRLPLGCIRSDCADRLQAAGVGESDKSTVAPCAAITCFP